MRATGKRAVARTTRRCRATAGDQRLLRRRQSRRRGVERQGLSSARSTAGSIALDAATGKPVWEVHDRRPGSALHDHRRAARRQGQGASSATAAPRSACAATSPPTTPTTGKQVWRFYTVPGDPSTAVREPGAREGREDLERRVVEARRRRHGLGFDGLRPGARPALHRHRQRHRRGISTLRSPGGGDNLYPVVDRRAQARHRRIRVALPDDARRNLGLHRHAAHDPRRPRRSAASRARCSCRRRRTASSTCSIARPASSSRRSTYATHELGQRARHEDGPADRRHAEARYGETGKPFVVHARTRRRAQLAADELQPADRARVLPGDGSRVPVSSRTTSPQRSTLAWNTGVDFNAGSLPTDPEVLDADQGAVSRATSSRGTRWRRRKSGACSSSIHGTAARSRPRATSCSRATPWASSWRTMRATGAKLWSVATRHGDPGAADHLRGRRRAVRRHRSGLGRRVRARSRRARARRAHRDEHSACLAFKLGGTAAMPAPGPPPRPISDPPPDVATAATVEAGKARITRIAAPATATPP